MAIEEHQLYKETLSNIRPWAMQKILEGTYLPAVLEQYSSEKLTNKQRYEYAAFYWCSNLAESFKRLEKIRDMTSRSLHKRKKENKGDLLEEWSIYNYELYTLVYQSILDIALLLINEVLDLGIPYRKCFFSTVCANRRVKGNDVERVLKKINNLSSSHREGKNLLLHRGQQIQVPLKKTRLNTEEISDIALKLDLEVSHARQLLGEFFAMRDRKQLIAIMEQECTKLESKVEQLCDEILPYYNKLRLFYS